VKRRSSWLHSKPYAEVHPFANMILGASRWLPFPDAWKLMTTAAIEAEGHSLGIEKNGHFFAVRKQCRGHQNPDPEPC